MVQWLIYLWVRYRMRKLITVHLQAMPIQISLRIVHGLHYKKNDDWQPSMRRNYRTKLGLGYDEAKFNYLNNSQFSCFKNIQPAIDAIGIFKNLKMMIDNHQWDEITESS